MKRILMLGCSYGVPNYFGLPGDPPETHIESLLTQAGHIVYNLSQNGGSNLNVISRVNEYLDGQEVPGVTGGIPAGNVPLTIKKPDDFGVDLIIWFHTSVLRDHRPDHGTLSEQVLHLSHATYDEIFLLRKRLEYPPIIVIGGTAPIFDFYEEYGTGNLLIIKNWIADLLQQELPSNHLVGAMSHMEDVTDEHDILEQQVSDAELIQGLMRESDLFPDTCHPGAQAHSQLYERLKPFL